MLAPLRTACGSSLPPPLLPGPCKSSNNVCITDRRQEKRKDNQKTAIKVTNRTESRTTQDSPMYDYIFISYWVFPVFRLEVLEIISPGTLHNQFLQRKIHNITFFPDSGGHFPPLIIPALLLTLTHNASCSSFLTVPRTSAAKATASRLCADWPRPPSTTTPKPARRAPQNSPQPPTKPSSNRHHSHRCHHHHHLLLNQRYFHRPPNRYYSRRRHRCCPRLQSGRVQRRSR